MKELVGDHVEERIGDVVYLFDRSLNPIGERSLTADEIDADQREQEAELALAEKQALRKAVRAIVDEVKTEVDRVQPVLDATNSDINNRPAQYIKDTARAVKRMDDAIIDIAKLLKDY